MERTPQELVGAMFSTPKELRHLAEQQFGELFVPTEVLADSPHSAVIARSPDSRGPRVGHAARARPGSPYRVTRVPRVHAARGDGRSSPPDR